MNSNIIITNEEYKSIEKLISENKLLEAKEAAYCLLHKKAKDIQICLLLTEIFRLQENYPKRDDILVKIKDELEYYKNNKSERYQREYRRYRMMIFDYDNMHCFKDIFKLIFGE